MCTKCKNYWYIKVYRHIEFSIRVQFSLVTQSCPTLCIPWTAARQGTLSITNSQSLPKLMSIELVMPSSHLILCHPLLLLPSIFPSIRVFSNKSALCIRWPKCWTFSFSITILEDGLVGSPCSPRDPQESSATPQFKSINSLVLSFFIVQLSHPYLTTGETIALSRRTFVGKVMFLLFNMLSRLVITFLPRHKHL